MQNQEKDQNRIKKHPGLKKIKTKILMKISNKEYYRQMKIVRTQESFTMSSSLMMKHN